MAGVLVMVTMGEPAALEARPPAPPSCHLRAFLIVERDVLTAQQKDVVRDEVERIWRPYGLSIEWPSVPGAYVRGTVSIMIRDTFPNAAVTRTARAVAVAWTIFTEQGPLPFIRASVDAARTVAAGARVGGRDIPLLPDMLQHQFIAQVIGRSIAHELGHYLLGRGHAEWGLMRQVIPPDDFFGARAANFGLSRAEVAALGRSPIWQACTTGGETRRPAG